MLVHVKKRVKEELKKVTPVTYNMAEKIGYYSVERAVHAMVRLTPKAMLDFEVQLAEHCNLNCARCSHFSPLAEKELLSLEEYTRDVTQLSLLFHKEASFIKLMGGEPLLNPEINGFMKITRECFPDTHVEIVTNGILLPTMDDGFYRCCAENNIIISVTKYPIKLNMEKIREKCDAFGVKLEFYYLEPGTDGRVFNSLPLDLSGMQVGEYGFVNCYLANNCHTLKHGKLYPCSTVPHIRHFNRYFNTDLKVLEDDGIDIYKVQDKKEILEFLAKPIPFCRYCNVMGRCGGFKWKISDKDIGEWT